MARPISLKKFEKHLFVRGLKPEDWESVVALEQRCFQGMETWTKEQFDSQLAVFPEGQIGVEYQGTLVAAEYKCDFILFPEIFTSQLLSLSNAENPAVAGCRNIPTSTSISSLDWPSSTNVNIIGGLRHRVPGAGIFTPSDIPFRRDAVAAECTPNIETVIFEDLDLELLKKHHQSGSVLNWQDRRTDLYDVRYLQGP